MVDPQVPPAWRESSPSTTAVVLRGTGLGLCFVLGVTAALLDNWDLTIVAAVIGIALAVDLWHDVRPRQFVLAGPDVLVIRTVRTTTAVSWAEASHTSSRRTPLRGRAPVLVRHDGRVIDLPRGVHLPTVDIWLAEHDDQAPSP